MNPSTPTPPPAKKKNRVNIGSAAGLLIGATLIGQLLGFLRTKLVNANFPTTGPQSTDAYFAAFNVPDFFFFTLAAGALGVAFMPVLSDRLYRGDRRGVWELSNSLMNLLVIIMGAVGFIMLFFAEPIIKYIVAPGLTGEQQDVAASIMRLLAFNPLLFTISGVLTSVQQTMGRFFFYAAAPLFYNVTIIISIYLFRDNIGLVGLGLGALIGSIIQLLVVMLGLWKLGYHWRPHIKWKSDDFHTILRNLPPRSLDQGMDQVENIVETRLASGLGSGAVSNYNNAFVLHTAPILLIGTAISTAAFPRLNARLSQHRPDLFRKDFLMVLRAMIWLSAPIVVFCFFARGYLARLIYTNGNNEIAIIFGFLTVAIFFRILYAIISRWFYAQKDTRTPLLISLFVIALNIYLAYRLSRPRPEGYGVEGLAMAQSIVAALEVFALGIIMLIRDRQLFDREFWSGIWRIISVTGFSLVAGFVAVSILPLNIDDRGFFTLGSKMLTIAVATIGIHVIVSYLFDLDEAKPVFRRIKRFILKPIKINV